MSTSRYVMDSSGKKHRLIRTSDIAFDIDGIVLDTATEMWRVITQYLDLPWSMNQWTHYDIGSIVGVDTKTLRPVYEPVLRRTDLPGVPGAADALNGLYYKYGDPLLFITARRKEFADGVRTSLGNLLNPDVEFTVLYTADNHEDEARNDKLDILKEYKVKLFVEDNALHWEQYIDNGIQIATLDWPWTFGQVMELRSRGKKIEMYSDWRGLHSYLDKFVESVNGRNK